MTDICPGFRPGPIASRLETVFREALLNQAFDVFHILFCQLQTQLIQNGKCPEALFQPPGIIHAGVERSVCIDNRLVEHQGVVENDPREIRNQNIRAVQHIKIVDASIPLQLLVFRVFFHQGGQHVAFRDKRLRMRPDDHMKACFQKLVDDF